MLPKAVGIAAAKGDSRGVWVIARRETWRVFIIRDPRVRLVIWLQIASDEGNAVLDRARIAKFRAPLAGDPEA